MLLRFILCFSLLFFVCLCVCCCAPTLKSVTASYQTTSTDAATFTPYLYPPLNMSVYEYNLLVPPLVAAAAPASPPRLNFQLSAASGSSIAVGYIANGATLNIYKSGSWFTTDFQSDVPIDSYIDAQRQAAPASFGATQSMSFKLSDFTPKTDIFAQVIDNTGSRSTYYFHATVAPTDSNVEVIVSMIFSISCDDIYAKGTDQFKTGLETELKNNLGSFAGITTVNVLSADCSSDVPAARFSIKSSASAANKQSAYDIYTEILKNVRNLQGGANPNGATYLPAANTIAVASVNVVQPPPETPSSANKNLAIIVGCAAAAAAIILGGIFLYFHKKKQSGQWGANKDNTAWAGRVN